MALPSAIAGFAHKDKFYTSSTPTDAGKVKQLVEAIQKAFKDGEKKQMVYILSGTHGTPEGDLVQERLFFYEDKDLEGQIYKCVNVWGFTKEDGTPVTNRWNAYTGSKAVVILAWCFSEQARTGWMRRAQLKGC